MSKKKDGGPAFPIASYDHQTFNPSKIEESQRLLSGMSLRAYIATHVDIASAFPGLIERASTHDNAMTLGHIAKKTAELRVVAADALIAELERDQ